MNGFTEFFYFLFVLTELVVLIVYSELPSITLFILQVLILIVAFIQYVRFYKQFAISCVNIITILSYTVSIFSSIFDELGQLNSKYIIIAVTVFTLFINVITYSIANQLSTTSISQPLLQSFKVAGVGRRYLNRFYGNKCVYPQ